MTESTHRTTFDWTAFWRDADETDRDDQSPADHHANDVLRDFIEARTAAGTDGRTDAGADDAGPEAIADVGCGPGTTVFALAEAFPDATIVGYDPAEPVIAENRRHADERGLENVRFEVGSLPEFAPGRQFDVVFSYFALCYVADPELALQRLYDAVAPGGHLVFNYQNRLARSHWRMLAEDPHEYLDEDSAWDPETFEARFELLIEGENLLSYERIHEALGNWPQSVWSVVEKPDIRWAWRHHPLVFVPK